MIKIKVVAVGKLANSSPEFILCSEYKKRISYGIEICEVNNKLSKEREAEGILKLLNKNNFIISLDENGKSFTSQEFSEQLQNFLLTYAQITFIIGGAEGLSKSLINKSQLILSLGKMTLPHKFARVILLEQIYRAQTILINHPYHK